jgi:predicted metalloprotease with PDZ domain
VYSREQPTPWLWVSEGITDYYADLTMVRSGVAADSDFFNTTANKIAHVANIPAVAIEDASLNVWVHPTDNTDYIYYDKGSLAGLMLDIIIRDASDNRRSLDDVMRELYRATAKPTIQGFTGTQWWAAISRAAGGRSFTEFNTRYVDGRDPYPWNEILPKAGMRLVVDTQQVARMGISSDAQDSSSGGVRISEVVPGGAMQEAGMQPGDILVRVADVAVTNPVEYGPDFRKKMAGQPAGTPYDVVVLRNGQQVTLRATLKYLPNVTFTVSADPNAGEKAVRIREGLLRGGR